MKGVTALEFPCKDCTDRRPGCHDDCAKYLKAKMKHDIKREQDFEKRESRHLSHLTFTKKNGNGHARCTQIEWERQRKKNKNYVKEF